MVNRLWALGAYASLQTSTQREDPTWAKFEGDMRARAAEIASDSIFFTLEINRLEDAEVEAALRRLPARRALAGRGCAGCAWPKGHELSAELERFCNDRAPALANWSRLYDETLSRMAVTVGRETLTLPQALNRLSDPDPKRRKASHKGLAKALEHDSATLALCLNTLASRSRSRTAGAATAIRPCRATAPTGSTPEAVQALEAAVVEHYPRLSHRYYALKARTLGKRVLDYWDRKRPAGSGAAAPVRLGRGQDPGAGLLPRTGARLRRPMPAPSSTGPGSTPARGRASRPAPIPIR